MGVDRRRTVYFPTAGSDCHWNYWVQGNEGTPLRPQDSVSITHSYHLGGAAAPNNDAPNKQTIWRRFLYRAWIDTHPNARSTVIVRDSSGRTNRGPIQSATSPVIATRN